MSKKKLMRISILVLSAAVLAAAIIMLIVSLFSMSYKKTVRSYCESLLTADFDTYWDTLSSVEYGGVDFDSRYNVLGQSYDSQVGYISSAVQSKTGEIKKVTVKFKDKSKLSRDEINQIYNTYVTDSSSVITADDLKSGKSIDIAVTVKGADGELTFNIDNLIVLKEGKSFRIFSLESDSTLAASLQQ